MRSSFLSPIRASAHTHPTFEIMTAAAAMGKWPYHEFTLRAPMAPWPLMHETPYTSFGHSLSRSLLSLFQILVCAPFGACASLEVCAMSTQAHGRQEAKPSERWACVAGVMVTNQYEASERTITTSESGPDKAR